ncbi:MAG: hypothetical protein II923_04125 [Campylobacter sp.]|nr:hypothetical protein [Campylobacter sp.]
MTELIVKAMNGKSEIAKMAIDCDKTSEKMLMEVYRKILLQIPVKAKESGKHIIFELTSKFSLENMQFSGFDYFIRQFWDKGDKFLFIYEQKYFVKHILGKAINTQRKDKR